MGSNFSATTDIFLGPSLKINRAKEHLDRLKAEFAEFQAKNPYGVTIEEQFQPRRRIIRFKEREQVPQHWSAIIGDILHNLRSALDNLAVGLVIANGCTSKTGINETSFPIAASNSDFEKMISGKQFRRASEKAKKVTRRLKPYQGGNDSLYIVRQLNNRDKHVAILPAVAAVGKMNSFLDGLGDLRVTLSHDPLKSFDLKDGDELFYAPVALGEAQIGPDNIQRDLPTPDDPKIQITFRIAFANTQVVDGQYLFAVLDKLVDVAERTVAIYRRHAL